MSIKIEQIAIGTDDAQNLIRAIQNILDIR